MTEQQSVHPNVLVCQPTHVEDDDREIERRIKVYPEGADLPETGRAADDLREAYTFVHELAVRRLENIESSLLELFSPTFDAPTIDQADWPWPKQPRAGSICEFGVDEVTERIEWMRQTVPKVRKPMENPEAPVVFRLTFEARPNQLTG